MSDIRKLLESLDKINEAAEVKATRRIQSNGRLVNFNIDRDDPSKLFIGIRSGGDSYSAEDVVKVYYGSEDLLQNFLGSRDGRNATEVDSDGNPVNASQSDAENDADSRDSGAAPRADNGAGDGAAAQAAPQTDAENDADSRDSGTSSGELTLSNGSSFSRGRESQRLLNQQAAQLVRRMNELLRKMNESVPTSMRGYIVEHNIVELLLEALSAQEEAELQQIFNDLRTIADFEDSQGSLISDNNRNLLRRKLSDNEAVINNLGSSTQNTNAGTNPEAERASSTSGDQDANVEPGEGETAGSLEAFANSGKGGLANDPDETAAIEELQQYLTDLGFDPNGVDGKYGGGTIAAVKQFQEYFGAKVDGDAGPETIGQIVELRSIRWGEGGSKTFVDWRNTMKRMEELIGKAGNATESVNASSSMNAILEMFRRLDEALSDEEADELQGIIDELRSAYEDGEFTAALPSNVQQRFSSNFQSAEGVLADMGRGGDEEGGDGEGGDEEDGEGDNAETTQFNAQEIADKIRDAISGLGTDEQAVYDAIDETESSENWAQVLRAYPDVYVDIYGDFGGQDLELVKSKLQNIGVTMPASEEEAEQQRDTAADERGAAARDGQDDAEADGAEAGADNGGGQGAAASIAQLPDPETEEDAMQIIAASAELQADLMAELTPEEQELFREMLAAIGGGASTPAAQTQPAPAGGTNTAPIEADF